MSAVAVCSTIAAWTLTGAVTRTRIDVDALQEGDEQSARSRHGRGQGILLSAHVMALLDLDGHRSLQVLGEHQADRFREGALHADVDYRSRAEVPGVPHRPLAPPPRRPLVSLGSACSTFPLEWHASIMHTESMQY
ncbi:hypothetical protein [Streptomyces griseus]|uniref:hypothetical protein n=1 Tax=Streptomyces griseus TaxID=1911 RepID=UPI0036621508